MLVRVRPDPLRVKVDASKGQTCSYVTSNTVLLGLSCFPTTAGTQSYLLRLNKYQSIVI